MSTSRSDRDDSRSVLTPTTPEDPLTMPKKEATITSAIVDDDSARKEAIYISTAEQKQDDTSPPTAGNVEERGRSWMARFFRLGPLIGLFGIAVAVASLFASLGVLVGSNGVPTSTWSVQPSALLAVFTAVGNQSMRFAAWQGVAIAWWVRASKSGSTLGRLHRDWRSGTTFRGAVMAGRHISWLGLACIFSTIVAVDGPLLQRATDVKLVPIEGVTVDLEAQISPEIPTDFTGTWFKLSGNHTVTNLWNSSIPTSDGNRPNNIQAIANADFLVRPTVGWLNDTTMSGFIRGCPGNCTAKVMAPAVEKTACTSHQVKVDYNQTLAPPNSIGVSTYPLNSMSFVIQISLLLGERESINLVTGTAFAQAVGEEGPDLPNCEGYFRYTACTLEPAVGMYDVQISDDIITLLSANPTIVALANNTRVSNSEVIGGHPSTLGGIVNEMSDYWGGVAAISQERGDYFSLGYGQSASEIFEAELGEFCFYHKDPQSHMIESMNTLMFRTGAFAASPNGSNLSSTLDPGFSYNNSVTGKVEGFHNIYVTTFKWFAAAAIVEVVCIILVLPTYYGWWTLGRSVTLSPLEIAKAFEAPVLKSCHSNSTAAEIARAVGETPIQYGAATTPEGLTRLALGNSESIQKPQKNAHFSF